MSKLDLEHKNPRSLIFNDFGFLFGDLFGYPLRPYLFFGTLSATFWGYSGLLFQPLHASSLKGNRSSIISLIWSRFCNHFCAFLMYFSSKRTKFLEVVWLRCVVEAAPQAQPEDHLGGIFRSFFVAEYNLGLTSALQHCQHSGAFRFLAAQVFSDFGVILRTHF